MAFSALKKVGSLKKSLKRRRTRDESLRKTLRTVKGVEIDLSLFRDQIEAADEEEKVPSFRESVTIRLSWRGVDQQEYTRAATIDRLLDRVLTSQEFKEGPSLDAFFLTYQIYVEGVHLLQLFMQRFDEGVHTEQTELQVRILKVLQFWLDTHNEDFRGIDSRDLVDKMFIFIKTRQKDPQLDERVKNQLLLIGKLLTHVENLEEPDCKGEDEENLLVDADTTTTEREKQIQKRTEDHSLKPWEVLLDPVLSPMEIAGQLTQFEVNMFRKIEPMELLGVAWSREGKEINSPNVRRLIEHFNRTSRWVAGIILEADMPEYREKMLQKFVDIASCCKELNNYNAVFEILAGINSVAVHRLKLLQTLPKQSALEYKKLHSFIKSEGNYATYRSSVSERAQQGVGCVPFLGVSFGDLRGIEMTMNDFEETSSGKMLINFKKQVRVAEIIRDLLGSFSPDFKIECLRPLRLFIHEELNKTKHTDDQLWSLSCKIKPSSIA